MPPINMAPVLGKYGWKISKWYFRTQEAREAATLWESERLTLRQRCDSSAAELEQCQAQRREMAAAQQTLVQELQARQKPTFPLGIAF